MINRQSPVILFVASANPGKLREFQTAAMPLGIDVKVLPRFSQLAACVEDGYTFEENARKKALYYSGFTDQMVFADDSGICIDALGGGPGIYSARFAGPGAADDANNQKLLAEIHRVEASSRSEGAQESASRSRAAYYVCVIALAQQGQILTTTEGRADGIIIDSPRGSGGFGYDPYFYYPAMGRTFAELAPEEKFTVSHRGEAFRKLLNWLS